ncbi:response regulator [Elusimicrobiota bacterium]
MDVKKVLIIDDEETARKLFCVELGRFKNVEVVEAADGERGLRLARSVKPDLILLDNMMPGLSGEQTAKKIRSDDQIKSIPIIMVTAMDLTGKEIDLIKLDVNEFLTKPINLWKLQEILQKYLGDMIEVL